MEVKWVTVEATKGNHYQVLGEYVENYSDTLLINTLVSYMRAEGWTVNYIGTWLDISDKRPSPKDFPIVCCSNPNCLVCKRTGQCPNCSGYSIDGICYLKLSETDKNAYIRELLRRIKELEGRQISANRGR